MEQKIEFILLKLKYVFSPLAAHRSEYAESFLLLQQITILTEVIN